MSMDKAAETHNQIVELLTTMFSTPVQVLFAVAAVPTLLWAGIYFCE